MHSPHTTKNMSVLSTHKNLILSLQKVNNTNNRIMQLATLEKKKKNLHDSFILFSQTAPIFDESSSSTSFDQQDVTLPL